MLIYAILIFSSVLTTGIIVYIITTKWHAVNYTIYIERAKAKASTIEKESALMIDLSKTKAEKELLDFKNKCQEEYAIRENNLKEKEKLQELRIQQELKDIDKIKLKTKQDYKIVDSVIKEANKSKEKAKEQTEKALNILTDYTKFTQKEAKDYILQEVEKNSKTQIAQIIRKTQNEAKENTQNHANYLLAQATTRFAYDFVNDRLSNKIKLENDDLKGRIIGKDGRNICALENVLGVDVIIDDTPNTITISSFNLYRRAIATKVLEILVEDGRVQPARIEDTYKKVSQEFEEKIYTQGQKVLLDLGIENMHTDLIKLIGKLRYRSSFGQNALSHSIEVAMFASTITAELGGDIMLARRAGILHDIGKALTNDKKGSHIELGAEICNQHNECKTVINAIYAHHEVEEPINIESASVCAGDVLSAARPGARRDAMDSFTSRLENIEEIAHKQDGILNAYAIDAGRELRVIVNAKMINDDQTHLIANNISQQIEKEVQYPGKIKVSVIRETRSVQYAT